MVNHYIKFAFLLFAFSAIYPIMKFFGLSAIIVVLVYFIGTGLLFYYGKELIKKKFKKK